MVAVARRRRALDIWPGFVDALAALLMVVIFVLLLFTLGQYFLNLTLIGQESALDRLNAQVARLGEMLSLEEAESAALSRRVQELTATLGTTRGQLSAVQRRAAQLVSDIEALEALKAQLETEVSRLGGALASEQAISAAAKAQVARLNRQIAALRTQLTEVSNALSLAEAKITSQEIKIADLGERLNLALASKVQELKRYRSEFFGRLREALGENPDIRIEGDRFVFQSELLFDTASATLNAQGRAQVRKIVATLKQVMPKIPDDLNWVLRIDGHTDERPIHTRQFASNWELSTARALAVVKYMVDAGIPPKRLAATGFGSHHPLDPLHTPAAWAKNRRIEIKLTSY